MNNINITLLQCLLLKKLIPIATTEKKEPHDCYQDPTLMKKDTKCRRMQT